MVYGNVRGGRCADEDVIGTWRGEEEVRRRLRGLRDEGSGDDLFEPAFRL